jgi:hypothetical protein
VFDLGPYRLSPQQGWPDDWLEYADETFGDAADDGRPLVRVTVSASAGAREPTSTKVLGIDVAPTAENAGGVSAAECFDARVGWSADDPDLHIDLHVERHFQHPHLTLGNALRGALSLALPRRLAGMMVHAASAVLHGEGVLFPGVSTAGKTTLALGMAEASFLSDDVSVVTNVDSSPQLVRSPFFGSAGRRGAKIDGGLRAIAILTGKAEPDGTTTIEAVPDAQSLPLLLAHVINWSNDASLATKLMQRSAELVAHVPVFTVRRSLATSSDDVLRQVLARAT